MHIILLHATSGSGLTLPSGEYIYTLTLRLGRGTTFHLAPRLKRASAKDLDCFESQRRRVLRGIPLKFPQCCCGVPALSL